MIESPSKSGSSAVVPPPPPPTPSQLVGGTSRPTTTAHEASVGALVLGAIGVVFGDIGTSPLYALKECVQSGHGVEATPENVLGLVSLIVWSLTVVVTVKYLAFLMKADNHGEGGIFALLALTPERLRSVGAGRVGWLPLAVIAGACLLFGDGIITPAISVLGALEGLQVATDGLERAVVPLTCVILAALFAIQKRGTGSVGRLFGPVMVAWFVTLGALGLWHTSRNPQVLAALSPLHAITFMKHHGWHGFKLLGSVVLAVTGGEALYADMGHFGRKPIRMAWLALVFPGLVLAYLGQGALLLSDPSAASQPFFRMVPSGLPTFALVGLAAPAAVIASQALISGVFSLTHQAMRLGYFPRVKVEHTDQTTEGQIYVPLLNWLLAAGSLGLVLVFQSSSKLAAAYGIAVTGTMTITSIVFFIVARHAWGWSAPKAWAMLLLFLSFDLAFFGASMLKFLDGGYIPVVVGAGFSVVMVTWWRGRSLLGEYYRTHSKPLNDFLGSLPEQCTGRLPGAGVFMASTSAGTPPILLHLVRRLRTVHETIVLFTATTEHTPFVNASERVVVEQLGSGCVRVIAHYGFFETPNVVAALTQAVQEHGLAVDLNRATYFVGRETFVEGSNGRMESWGEALFALLMRNARNASLYFGVPPDQVVEVGMRIDL